MMGLPDYLSLFLFILRTFFFKFLTQNDYKSIIAIQHNNLSIDNLGQN